MRAIILIIVSLLFVGCTGMAPRTPQEVAAMCPPGSQAVAEAVAGERGPSNKKAMRVACVRPDGTYVAAREAAVNGPRGYQAKREEVTNFERKNTSVAIENRARGVHAEAGYSYRNPFFGLRVQAGTGGDRYPYGGYRSFQDRRGMCYVAHKNGLSGWYHKSSVSRSVTESARSVRCY